VQPEKVERNPFIDIAVLYLNKSTGTEVTEIQSLNVESNPPELLNNIEPLPKDFNAVQP
jgi:hypothetical protein